MSTNSKAAKHLRNAGNALGDGTGLDAALVRNVIFTLANRIEHGDVYDPRLEDALHVLARSLAS